MFVLKGFLTHASLQNNALGIVSPIGEISTYALTFAREKGIYKSPTISNDISLVSFKSANNAIPVVLTNDIVEHVVTIGKYIYDQSFQHQSTPIILESFLEDLLANFATVADTFDCGDLVNDGIYYLPEWVSWKNKSISTMGTDNIVKIWLSDPSFRIQYDEYEIVVVPPTDDVDDFFMPASDVQIALNAFSPSDLMQRIQEAKGKNPETIIRADVYNYVDPYNAATKIPTIWNVLIYGPAGDNIDAVNDALTEYVLANSVHARDQWRIVMPDMFRHTEFILAPEWTHYAIPERSGLAVGIYSPITTLQDALTLIEQVAVSYPTAHINAHAQVIAQPYKSLSIVAVGSDDNRNSQFKITDVFPDFISVLGTSIDFNRMSQVTQDWANMINTMLLIAETMNQFTSIPNDMTKTTRNGILYLVKRYKEINYLVAAKQNFPLPSGGNP